MPGCGFLLDYPFENSQRPSLSPISARTYPLWRSSSMAADGKFPRRRPEPECRDVASCSIIPSRTRNVPVCLRSQRELIHCGDHHRWRPMVNFLVDDQNRNAGMWLLARFSLRELATSQFVSDLSANLSTVAIIIDGGRW